MAREPGHPDYAGRLAALRSSVVGAGALLVTDVTNIRYMTGFTGSSAALFVTRSANVFVTDFRYGEQAEAETSGWELLISKRGVVASVIRLMRSTGAKRLLFESSVSYEFFRKLSLGVKALRATSGAIERMRAVKDHYEAGRIREAVRRAEEAFRRTRPYIRPGTTERAVALRLGDEIRKTGSRRPAFDIIVASGPNSSRPHAGVSGRRIGRGDLLVIDWGAEADGYVSDMTRTFLVKGGDASKKREIYGLVLEANRRAVRKVRPGRYAHEVDASARDVIEKAGYGRFFGHGLGHGVGLAVHELPRVSKARTGTIEKGMVFTVEPGVYVPGLGGVRIEDMVRVGGRGGCEVLTTLPKGLEMIG